MNGTMHEIFLSQLFRIFVKNDRRIVYMYVYVYMIEEDNIRYTAEFRHVS